VILAAVLRAMERSTAIFVALAVQLAAIAVVGDVFAAAPHADAGLPPPSEPIARAAPAARGEHLIRIDLTLEATVPSVQPEPSVDGAADLAAKNAAAPPADAIPIAEPAPPPRPDPTRPPSSRSAPTTPAVATLPATSDAELRMLVLMNASRSQGGLAPLALDGAVSDTARRHSAVEAQYRYVYHDGPDGTAASRNVPACGSGWYGENTGKVWSGGVDALHREFMAEPWEPINHRTNIMDPNFRRAGIGAVQGPDALYITVVFCR